VVYNTTYQTGYGYQWSINHDPHDSKVISIRAIAYLSNGDSIEALCSAGELNVESLDGGSVSKYS
jgi:hypothetical protein